MSEPSEAQSAHEAALKAQARRNVWLGLALFGFVILIAVITMTRIGAEATKPDGSFYYRADDGGSSVSPESPSPGEGVGP
ncbi:MAG: hypothetical protein AAFQ67_04585 [Pseudomonadota bacterium]